MPKGEIPKVDQYLDDAGMALFGVDQAHDQIKQGANALMVCLAAITRVPANGDPSHHEAITDAVKAIVNGLHVARTEVTCVRTACTELRESPAIRRARKLALNDGRERRKAERRAARQWDVRLADAS